MNWIIIGLVITGIGVLIVGYGIGYIVAEKKYKKALQWWNDNYMEMNIGIKDQYEHIPEAMMDDIESDNMQYPNAEVWDELMQEVYGPVKEDKSINEAHAAQIGGQLS